MPWPKGKSGNPGGRPHESIKGLARKIRESTGDGEKIVDFYLAVFRGEALDDGRLPTLAQRMEAAGILLDRGFGKAVTPIDLTTGGEGLPDALPFDPGKLSEAALLEITRAAAPMLDVEADERAPTA